MKPFQHVTKSLQKLGKEFNVARPVIKRVLKKHGIPLIKRKNQFQ